MANISGSSYPVANQQSYAPTRQVITSAWQVIEQPPPPTLREILHAYKSKGDGDREMLLAMLNAKSSEDQRIAAMATLHHKLLELPPLSSTCPSSPQSLQNGSTQQQQHHHQQQQPAASYRSSPTSLSKTPPLVSPQSVTLPPIHVVSQQNPHKRPRSSQSPPPYQRRHSAHSSDHSMAPNPNEILPPSPPFSSPGRSTACSELTTHPQSRGDAMAIGSLLSSEQERDSEWPSRTSAERDRERDATYHKPSKVSG